MTAVAGAVQADSEGITEAAACPADERHRIGVVWQDRAPEESQQCVFSRLEGNTRIRWIHQQSARYRAVCAANEANVLDRPESGAIHGKVGGQKRFAEGDAE